MKIFLTGANGFIGSHLLSRLTDLNYEVCTNIRYFDGTKWDCIIHLAATTTIDTAFNPMIFENNIVFAKKILSTPYRTIYASSCSARHNTNPYAYSKIYNEWLGEKHGNAIGLRFFNVYGLRNNKGIIWFLTRQPDGAKITIRGPELVRDYVYVDDVVNAIIQNIVSTNPVVIDLNYVREVSEKLDPEELLKLAMEQNIHIVEPDEKPTHISGVFDVGTGTGLQTMDVVNLYQRLSGKNFDISIAEAADNEPKEMIAQPPLQNALTLEEGLSKMMQL